MWALLTKEFIRNRAARIFLRKITSLSMRRLRPSYATAIQIQRGVFGKVPHLNYNPMFDRPTIDANNAEVGAFQEYLCHELEAVKFKLGQAKNKTIKKNGYMRLPIKEITGSQIKFTIIQVCLY